MIRGVIGLFVFAVALCAYIVVAPGAKQPLDPLGTAVDVTRAQTETLLPGVPLPQETAALPQTKAPTPLVPAEPIPSERVATDNTTVFGTTSGVLAGLGLEIDPATLNSDTGEMAAMTDDVLADIGAITGTTVRSTARSADTALERLIVAALKEGRSDSEIDQMVNAAAIAGDLTVPEVLVTSDGTVDTHVLLKSIVVQATIASGGGEPEVPDAEAIDSTGIDIRFVRGAEESQQYRFYTVSSGDSLGAIAIKFYGNVDKYPLIFQANRDILSSPNNIRVGQRLAIPALPRA